MNALDKYIVDHPEGVEKFKTDNMALINDIKSRFRKFTDDGNILGRVLLADALFEILKVERDLSKALMKAQMFNDGGLVVLEPEEEWWWN